MCFNRWHNWRMAKASIVNDTHLDWEMPESYKNKGSSFWALCTLLFSHKLLYFLMICHWTYNFSLLSSVLVKFEFFLVIMSDNHLVYSAILNKYPGIINKSRQHETQDTNRWWSQECGKYAFLIESRYFSGHINSHLKMYNLSYSIDFLKMFNPKYMLWWNSFSVWIW